MTDFSLQVFECCLAVLLIPSIFALENMQARVSSETHGFCISRLSDRQKSQVGACLRGLGSQPPAPDPDSVSYQVCAGS